VAHDLRNPLNAVAGYADLVQKLGEVNPQQEKWLTRIRQTTNKLYELAFKLVDLAWIEAGMPMEYVPVELTSLTRDVMDALRYQAHKQEISIVNSIPDELPAVMGDPGRLRQTIHNLLDNALRYSLPQTNVVIHAWHQADEVLYTVADQGIGIAEDDQEKIWDRMWRSGDDRVRDTSGGGIGLPFAQTIIKRHGGTIWVESELNQGTTFTFRLPVTRGG
jgi:signal transduction histidine kinase